MGSWGTEHKVLNAAVILQVQQLATRRDEVKKGATTKKTKTKNNQQKEKMCVTNFNSNKCILKAWLFH